MNERVLAAARSVPVSKGPEFQRPVDLPFTCSDDDLLEAVQTYLCGGTMPDIARLLGVEPAAAKNWTSAAGWKFIEECVRDDVRKIAHSNLTRIVHRCFGLIDDRLEKGDPIYDLEGEVVGYRAVKVKDLGAIAATLYDKIHELEDRTSGRHEEEQMALRDLAQSLREFAKVKQLERLAIPGLSTEVPESPQ